MNFLFASDSFKGTLTSEETISLLTKAAEVNDGISGRLGSLLKGVLMIIQALYVNR